MTRFLKFINENNKNSNIGNVLTDTTQIKELLKTRYSHALERYKKGFMIYRGIPSKNDFLEFKKENRKPRISANTDNYYTLLLDSGYVKWMNKFPKRSMSLICINSLHRATVYDEPFVVFPENGADIGICPEEDIWDSFNYEFMGDYPFHNLNIFNWFINQIQKHIHITFTTNNATLFTNELNSISIESIKDIFIERLGKTETNNIIKKYKTLLYYLTGYLNNAGRHFKIKKIETYNILNNNELHEVWTDASCLLINWLSIKDIIKEI